MKRCVFEILALGGLILGTVTAASQPPQRSARPEFPGHWQRPGGAGGDDLRTGPALAGIQWFAIWESGLREARRTGRPILLVSAAPHCAGVSGIW